MLRAQAPDDARKETFGSAHRLEREMRPVMPDAGPDAPRLGAQKGIEIDVGQDEFDLFYVSVETRAGRGEESRTAPRLIPRERKKTDEERERGEDEDEIPHGG